MLSLLNEGPVFLLIRVAVVLAAITIHEFFHGLAADKLGDPTPRINDRLSLNPIKHLDPVGTLALFFIGIGWAKPVPIDPFNFLNKKRDTALVSLAGPGSNIITAVLVALIMRFLLPLLPVPLTVLFIINQALLMFIVISLGLALFNLIPVPPLDGSKILFALLPNRIAYEWEQLLEQYGLILLLFLVFPFFGGQPLAMKIIGPILNLLLNFLLG